MSAVAELIGSALASAVTGLGLTGLTVKRRKRPTLPAGTSPPVAVVTVGEEAEVEHLWAGVDAWRYTVAVTLITAGGSDLADDATLRDWREQVRGVLNAASTYSGVNANEVWPGGRPPFPRPGLDSLVNYSVLVARVEVLETRTH